MNIGHLAQSWSTGWGWVALVLALVAVEWLIAAAPGCPAARSRGESRRR
ncbi:MAG TPA: hypothetical protein VFA86_08540 [Gammaproteobacteria bacterium]|nr:hypothetical protein [Gammaproteobacteria bacterium]